MAGEVYDARKEFPMEHGLMEDCGGAVSSGESSKLWNEAVDSG